MVHLGPCQISIEAAVCNCSSKQVFLKISQYSQETPTTLCPQNVTNAKKQYALNFVCSSYKIRLPWHICLLRIKELSSLLSHPEVSCIPLCASLLWDGLYLAKHHSSFRVYLTSTNLKLGLHYYLLGHWSLLVYIKHHLFMSGRYLKLDNPKHISLYFLQKL